MPKHVIHKVTLPIIVVFIALSIPPPLANAESSISRPAEFSSVTSTIIYDNLTIGIPLPATSPVSADKKQPTSSSSQNNTTKLQFSYASSNGNDKASNGELFDTISSSSIPTLPVTGGNWIWFALFANMVMLFFGKYLRLHSGGAPSRNQLKAVFNLTV